MKILAIETSCDETAISVLEVKGGEKRLVFNILSNIVSSQVKVHAQWGGVVPGLAKREHQANLVSVLTKALKQANLLNPLSVGYPISNRIEEVLEREPVLLEKTIKFLEKHEKPEIDAIAFTQGPGLEPALWVGINFAKALSVAWDIPLIPVNHMLGHMLAPFLQDKEFEIPKIEFPAVALLVSGGHTQIVLIKKWGEYELVGETRDDAAGEAFDKVAKMLGLSYPGGPIISKLASNVRSRTPNIDLPRPMMDSGDFDFSFSGLKTAVLYKLKDPEIRKYERMYGRTYVQQIIAKEFQQAVIDVLIAKTMGAAEKYGAKNIILGGGVTANKEIRKQFKKAAKDGDYELFLPKIKFTGDNAAMIALAGYFTSKKKKPAHLTGQALKAEGNLTL